MGVRVPNKIKINILYIFIYKYIYIKCYLNNKKLNAAEKHRRDVLVYELAIV